MVSSLRRRGAGNLFAGGLHCVPVLVRALVVGAVLAVSGVPALAESSRSGQQSLQRLFQPSVPTTKKSGAAASPSLPLKLAPALVPSQPQSKVEEKPAVAAPPPSAPAGATPKPSFVTMCVRLCDGYYWPISNPTEPANLKRDRDQCEMTCGAPAKLYIQHSFGGNAAQMVDLDGKSYKKLKTAFLYRKKIVPNCLCRPQPWSEAELARHDEYSIIARAEQLQAELEAEMAAAGATALDDTVGGSLEVLSAEAEVPPLPTRLPVTKDGPNPPVNVIHLVPAAKAKTELEEKPKAKAKIAVIKVLPAANTATTVKVEPAPAVAQPQVAPDPPVATLKPTKASPASAGAALAVRKQIVKDPRQLGIRAR